MVSCISMEIPMTTLIQLRPIQVIGLPQNEQNCESNFDPDQREEQSPGCSTGKE